MRRWSPSRTFDLEERTSRALCAWADRVRCRAEPGEGVRTRRLRRVHEEAPAFEEAWHATCREMGWTQARVRAARLVERDAASACPPWHRGAPDAGWVVRIAVHPAWREKWGGAWHVRGRPRRGECDRLVVPHPGRVVVCRAARLARTGPVASVPGHPHRTLELVVEARSEGPAPSRRLVSRRPAQEAPRTRGLDPRLAEALRVHWLSTAFERDAPWGSTGPTWLEVLCAGDAKAQARTACGAGTGAPLLDPARDAKTVERLWRVGPRDLPSAPRGRDVVDLHASLLPFPEEHLRCLTALEYLQHQLDQRQSTRRARWRWEVMGEDRLREALVAHPALEKVAQAVLDTVQAPAGRLRLKMVKVLVSPDPRAAEKHRHTEPEWVASVGLTPGWRDEWGGEVIVYDDRGEPGGYAGPAEGTILLFDGARLHGGRTPISLGARRVKTVLLLIFEGDPGPLLPAVAQHTGGPGPRWGPHVRGAARWLLVGGHGARRSDDGGSLAGEVCRGLAWAKALGVDRACAKGWAGWRLTNARHGPFASLAAGARAREAAIGTRAERVAWRLAHGEASREERAGAGAVEALARCASWREATERLR